MSPEQISCISVNGRTLEIKLKDPDGCNRSSRCEITIFFWDDDTFEYAKSIVAENIRSNSLLSISELEELSEEGR